jgi:hypothetical protein
VELAADAPGVKLKAEVSDGIGAVDEVAELLSELALGVLNFSREDRHRGQLAMGASFNHIVRHAKQNA